MISNVKFNELEKRLDLLVEKVLNLELQIKSLTDSQGGEIPPGMAPVSSLAAEYGISTKKAEELAKNTGGTIGNNPITACKKQIGVRIPCFEGNLMVFNAV